MCIWIHYPMESHLALQDRVSKIAPISSKIARFMVRFSNISCQLSRIKALGLCYLYQKPENKIKYLTLTNCQLRLSEIMRVSDNQ